MEPSQWNLKTALSLSHEDLVENGSLKLKFCTGADGEIRLNHILDNADIATCRDPAPPSLVEVKAKPAATVAPKLVEVKAKEEPKNPKVTSEKIENEEKPKPPERDQPPIVPPFCKGLKGEIPLNWENSNKEEATCQSGSPYTDLLPHSFFETHHI